MIHLHVVLDHWNLEAMVQKQCHSGWIKELNSSGLHTKWWHGVQKCFSTDQNVIDISPGIHHSPYEVHSRIHECHHGYSVKEEQVSPNIMFILPNIIHQLTSIVAKPWIDLFATKPSYVSHGPDGRTYSVDALTAHWGGTWPMRIHHMHCYPRSYPKFSQKTT